MSDKTATPRQRKKRESGLTKRALSELKYLVPHFTSHQLAFRTQMTLVQASKTCGYLKSRGFVRVVGSARLAGSKGEPASIFEVTEAYEEARKKNPSLFSEKNLQLVPPTPIEKARESKKPKAETLEGVIQLSKKVDGLIDVIDELVVKLHRGLGTRLSLDFSLEESTKVREKLKGLLEINPSA